MLPIILCLLVSLFATLSEAGTINRPSKSFGGTIFINGVVPQASDFNGDTDTIYSEFNGSIDNANIKNSAAIAATKINPDGFTTNIRSAGSSPCEILDETDQTADLRRWAMCSSGGAFQLNTWTDANVLQNTWFTVVRANGGFTLGGASGTNTVNGVTTFNHAVTFTGGTTLTPTGMVTTYVGTAAPTGWLLMDGTSNSCTGASGANASLCAQLVGLFASVDYKGTAAATVTVDTASNEVIHTAHGRVVNDRVHFSSTTTLPAPLAATTVYCIISVTTDRFKISTTCGGAEVDITTTGTGTHSDYFNFITPDMRNGIATGYNSGNFSSSVALASNLPWSAGSGFTSTGTGSTAAHEGSVTISSNQNLSGVHFYTNFTLNSSVTLTIPVNAHRLIIVATDTITINGTIAGGGSGSAGGAGGGVNTNGGAGRPGVSQAAGGGGGAAANSGGAGGDALIHGLINSAGGAGGAAGNGTGGSATSLTGSNIPLAQWVFLGGAGGGGAAGGAVNPGGAGGNGGGSIILIAPTVVLASTATLNTSGNNGQVSTGFGGGGGGAGNVYVITRTFTDNGATFTMTAGTGTTGGGNGAAGVKQILLTDPTTSLTTRFISYIIKL